MRQNVHNSYAACIKQSIKAHWKLEDLEGISLDFSKPFLPEDLARTSELAALNGEEQLRLNQIRGHAYAYLFRYVEEFIIRMLDGIRDDVADEERSAALETFYDEERKHQRLFLLFEERFRDGFPVSCETIGAMKEVGQRPPRTFDAQQAPVHRHARVGHPVPLPRVL